MEGVGLLPEGTKASDIFVVVSNVVTFPGLFGLIMAALVAALMSTADTLVNGMSSIAINDIWRPYLLPNRPDRVYLTLARIHCVVIMGIGLSLVPLFEQFRTIYDAHGAFTAAVTPPLVVSLLLAIVWRRFNRYGVLAVLTLGTFLVTFSLFYPEVIRPFAHGVVPEEGIATYKVFPYMRACYGMIVCLAVGVIGNGFGTLLNPSLKQTPDDHLSLTSRHTLMSLFKGGKPNLDPGKPVLASLEKNTQLSEEEIRISPRVAEKMNARVGDLLYIEDERRWLGGLKSVHGRLKEIAEGTEEVQISGDLIERGRFDANRSIRIRKVF